jgi:2-oxoglutarate ferredoxin oxidoreductase subunit alpha
MCSRGSELKPVERLDRVIIRFAGDSGDGMQLTGDRFTSETALMGNDHDDTARLPAEIRAPAGLAAGVSGFQVHFADHDIFTPGRPAECPRCDEPRRAEDEPPAACPRAGR